ncbi:c-type cytochrome biogenesis protein CcmI [Devosia albogilva]|uniref:C-type cytochrome biogenesis protein CcmI n=1 Tax=Devosia albogilva TaxID=429726 RepID=A0ABW5QNI0_9HYPH
MLFWFVAIAVTAIACAALFYAAGPRAVNASAGVTADPNSHFRLVLAGIEADVASGRLGQREAEAARGELAREMLRSRTERGEVTGGPPFGRLQLVVGLALIAAVSFAVYGWLGSPQQPAQPLAERPELTAQTLDLAEAVARIEAALAANPDDLRGWTVIAPAYTQMGRYADAVNAWRRVLALGGTNPDAQTRLAEALLLESNGTGSAEAMDLLRAAATDPQHVPSRLYLAAELTRTGAFEEAEALWREVLALAEGTEPWIAGARQGLAVAENRGAPAEGAPDIGAMVSGLAERLARDGGTVEEWTQLVQSYIVLGDTAAAQAAYDDAVAAYPQAFDRGELDTLALGAGLELRENGQ